MMEKPNVVYVILRYEGKGMDSQLFVDSGYYDYTKADRAMNERRQKYEHHRYSMYKLVVE